VEVVGVTLGSEGSACGSKDDDEVKEDVEDAGEADRRVRRSVEGTLSISAIMRRCKSIGGHVDIELSQ
jgi:hypothetical protein